MNLERVLLYQDAPRAYLLLLQDHIDFASLTKTEATCQKIDLNAELYLENTKPNSRLQKYFITDNFLNFWFRFLYRNYSAIETENFNYIKTLLKRDYLIYCGKILEKIYHELFAGTGKYNRIGSYWEKGKQNEIDLVAVT